MDRMDDEKAASVVLQATRRFRHLVSRYQGAMRLVAVAIVGTGWRRSGARQLGRSGQAS